MRTLLVDDEELARERLRMLLRDDDDVQVVGEAAGGEEAVAAIERLRPDLVFLDVQMPEVDGFDVVARLSPDAAPAIVFATAYDEFAVRAFEANAVDYLLKPIGMERLRAALLRARARMGSRADDDSAGMAPLLETVNQAVRHRDRLAIRSGEGYKVVRMENVLWIEAADNYVRLHTESESLLHRTRMADLELMLDPGRFLRVHRSAIVNLDRVTSIDPWGTGEFLLTLTDRTRITTSRNYRHAIREAFGC